MNKGISPLIATVLLLSIVISITVLIGPEILTFVGDRTEETTRRSLDDIDCGRAGIYIRNITCHANGEESLTIDVVNSGHQDLTDFRIELLKQGQWEKYQINESDEVLVADSSRVFTVNETFEEGEIDEIEEGRFISGTCPNTASRDISSEEFIC